MDSREILISLGAAYRAMSSYSDSGVVLTYLSADEPPNETLFRTWFSRPDSFRFDWRSHHPYLPLRHLVTNRSIRSVGGSTIRWQDDPEREDADSLDFAIARATGVSQGAALHVPQLLMPGVIEAFQFGEMERQTYEGVELFENAPCHVVAGYHPNGTPHRLWIDESRALLRKIRTEWSQGSASEEIHRDTVVDGGIPANVFLASGSMLDAA
jgi:hypothetical protein